MCANRRTYLPRSTTDSATINAVYEYAEEKGLSFGKALEIMLSESKTFHDSLEVGVLPKDKDRLLVAIEKLKVDYD